MPTKGRDIDGGYLTEPEERLEVQLRRAALRGPRAASTARLKIDQVASVSCTGRSLLAASASAASTCTGGSA